jgi:hypothetical protein
MAMASEPELRDLFTRVAVLERQAAVSDERHTQNLARFDKLDSGIVSMDGKLDKLIDRNSFQDGGSNARGKLGKGVLTVLGILLSGSGITYLINWLSGRPHP